MKCPLCNPCDPSQDIKICEKHQAELEFAGEPDVELVKLYCNN